jgi:predicted AAA+ superfamily ATPase
MVPDGTAVMRYRSRLIDPLLDELLDQLPALLMVGPRTAGKTTTMARRAATVVRLDRQVEAASFQADPDVALRGLPEPVLLDEWQRVPGVLGAVRRAVEANPRPNRFFVTGSVRAELQHELWPGTGRLVRLAMYPMAIREQLGGEVGSVDGDGRSFFDRLADGGELIVPQDPPDLRGYVELALRSGFPDPALRLRGRARELWLESYIDDLLTHDVEQFEPTPTKQRDTARLRLFLEAYALNSAGIAEQRTIYEAAQVSRVTATAYEDLLEGLLVAERVPAWRSNRLKRLVHRPKRYLVDAALVATSLRLDERGILRDGGLLGCLLDTFVVAQLRPELAIAKGRPRLHHLRTEQGRHEVDLVVEFGGGRVVGIEVKATAAPTAHEDAKHLRWLRKELGERFLAGLVLHTGPRVYELDDRILAAPIAVLWG